MIDVRIPVASITPLETSYGEDTVSRHLFFFMITVLFASAVSAGPLIEFDTKEFDCGTVNEGKTKKLDAVFTLKNSGDSTLFLTGVKPGCGCTVVNYDSIIKPGKSALIKATVRIGNFKSGPMSKPITVTSNATNDSIVRLVIKATIQASIDPSTILITMRPNEKALLELITPKNNLKVSEVLFTPSGNNSDASGEKKKSVSVNYTLASVDSARTDKLSAYRLELEPFAVDASTEGTFTIATNHPDKKLLRIRGRVGD